MARACCFCVCVCVPPLFMWLVLVPLALLLCVRVAWRPGVCGLSKGEHTCASQGVGSLSPPGWRAVARSM